MNKQEFIKVLNKKLSGLNESERIDIINEYTLNIDEKVSNGMTEEEAILGFGDINEFVKEILDIYKSNKIFVLTSRKNKIVFRFKQLLAIFKKNEKAIEVKASSGTLKSVGQTCGKTFGKSFEVIGNFISKCYELTIKTVKWIAKVFLILLTTSVGVVLGMSIIFTVMGFPTFGIMLGLLALFVALGVWLTKCNEKILVFIISFILCGIGTGITILDVASFQWTVFDDDILFNEEFHTRSYRFDSEKPLYIDAYSWTKINIEYDENVEKGELLLETFFDDNYFYVNSSLAHREDENELFIYLRTSGEYDYEYFKALFWNLRDKKITTPDEIYYLDEITIIVNPDTICYER